MRDSIHIACWSCWPVWAPTSTSSHRRREDSATKQDKLFSSVASDNIEELTVKNDA